MAENRARFVGGEKRGATMPDKTGTKEEDMQIEARRNEEKKSSTVNPQQR